MAKFLAPRFVSTIHLWRFSQRFRLALRMHGMPRNAQGRVFGVLEGIAQGRGSPAGTERFLVPYVFGAVQYCAR